MTKVKNFLQKWIINNLGFKILALVFAFVLWLVITNTTDPTMTRTISKIPVEILNEDLVLDGTHVYTVLSGSQVTVVASGKRSIVGSLTADDFVATADFSELSITNAVPITVELTGTKAKYASSIMLTQKTASMVISLEDMDEKTLNVQVQFTGQEVEGLIIEDAVANPAMVTLHAPQSVIDNVERAVVLVDYSEVTGNTTLEKTLIIYDKEGNPVELSKDVYLDQETVDVKITTNGIKVVPVKIEAYGEPAEGYELSGVTLSKTEVSVRGTQKALKSVNEIVLPETLLDISGQKKDVTIQVNLEDYLPEGVMLYGDTGTVTVVATIVRSSEEQTTEKETETESETETETETETDTEEEEIIYY